MKRVGGMNHILLPGKADLAHFDAQSRYAVNAMELLINEILKKGGLRSNLVAKVFGGGSVIPAIKNEFFVGTKNIEFVKKFLKTENIKIVSHDLGGNHTRVVLFNACTGEAFVKRSKTQLMDQVVSKEKQRAKRIIEEIKETGPIELFLNRVPTDDEKDA